MMRGEGEGTFAALTALWEKRTKEGSAGDAADREPYAAIAGITWRSSSGSILENPDGRSPDMDSLPFLYSEEDLSENRIIYYESSRGCPYSCSYCLSSLDRRVRARSLEKVKEELAFFLDRRVSQVKFVDRTFNYDSRRALDIWRFLKERDNGVTNFHFEINAELMTEEELALLGSLRPGQVQLEIGVQSTNRQTLAAIRRPSDFARLSDRVNRLKEKKNIHLHLDLIAGLPYEDGESFRKSFNDVMDLHPSQLQLGFLKVLKGSPMEAQAAEFGCRYHGEPAYEVLSTNWLSYAGLIRLKSVEEMVEAFYNSAQFTASLPVLETWFPDYFGLYEALADFHEKKGFGDISVSRLKRYELLLEFCESLGRDRETLIPSLVRDLYLRENLKNRPAWAKDTGISKEEERAFYDREEKERKYLPGYRETAPALKRLTHLERFSDGLILFDYRNRDPLTGNAKEIRAEE